MLRLILRNYARKICNLFHHYINIITLQVTGFGLLSVTWHHKYRHVTIYHKAERPTTWVQRKEKAQTEICTLGFIGSGNWIRREQNSGLFNIS